MCGITGIFAAHDEQVDESMLRTMTDLLSHRGPDESGHFLNLGVGLGHRRLSIIDLSAGKQPMLSADKQVALTFNGEIYNHRLLRDELGSLGHRFQSNSDTEVLLHAWIQWGERCVHKLRGMFAFAVWDAATESLFLARDQIGIKPLYYGVGSRQQFVFASELKALILPSIIDATIDPMAVEDYFAFGYVPEPRTIYKSIWKLPPGCTLSCSRRPFSFRVDQYWDVPFGRSPRLSEDEYSFQLVKRLDEAVEMQMVADVPLGAFLSGGVDSSAIVRLMADHSPDPIKTFAIGFEDSLSDETQFAGVIANACGTEHTVRQVKVDDFSLIDNLIDIYDEPYADSSALPTYRVAQLARESVKVALSGDGGDECFAGYWRYREFLRAERAHRLVPGPLQLLLQSTLGCLIPRSEGAGVGSRIRGKLQFYSDTLLSIYMNSIAVVKPAERFALFSDSLRRELAGYNAIEVLNQHALNAPIGSGIALVSYLDFKTYLPGDILTKVDRASMAHGLEVRVPFLDHEFVGWASSVPADMKMKIGGEAKYILKKSFEPQLPGQILYRKKKGFSVPLDRWFRGPLRQRISRLLRSTTLLDSGFISDAYLRYLADRLDKQWYDCSSQLWALLIFESFLKRRGGCM